VHLVGFTTQIYHDARPYKRQILFYLPTRKIKAYDLHSVLFYFAYTANSKTGIGITRYACLEKGSTD
jgi:hypothetical protein